MKCFRITTARFARKDLLLNGEGASDVGGRWNPLGVRATYTGLSTRVVSAEKGYYAIRHKLLLREKGTVGSPSLPQFFLDGLVDVHMVMSELHVNPALKILDLSDQKNLSTALDLASLPPFTVDDARKSPFELLPLNWTQRLALHLIENGMQGILAPSARSNDAKVLVAFNDNLDRSSFELKSQHDSYLSALDLKGKKLDGLRKADVSKILLEYSGDSILVDVLNIPR